jgi:hypothetical protein
MIVIDNKLVSDEILEEKFVCDLSKCKGGCCEEGDAGAPLAKEELDLIIQYYDAVKAYMTDEGKRKVERSGKYEYDREFGWVTPTIDGGICAYGYKDKNGIIMCAFEQAYNDKKTGWKKPVSCHLFPIKTSVSKLDPDMEYLNYIPREDLCQPACSLGKKLKVPAYVFLKEPLIRKYGEEFYQALEAAAKHLESK